MSLQDKPLINNHPANFTQIRAAILSLSGLSLREDEAKLFAQMQPLGFILFRRNIDNPKQVKKLIADLRANQGWHCPILIDQEGGRVARFQPPFMPKMPAARHFGDLYGQDAVAGHAAIDEAYTIMAKGLADLGVNVNCAPVLDVAISDTHESIGDRAYSAQPDVVVQCGLAVCQAFIEQGVTPVVKHMPGHGRALCDSHFDLPVVDAPLSTLKEQDFVPFSTLANSDMSPYIWGMPAHILFPALDKVYPASLSPKIIADIIRDHIGFNGFLLSDDVDMKGMMAIDPAYERLEKRAVDCLSAGTDAVLYCSGDMDDMMVLSDHIPCLRPDSIQRFINSQKIFEADHAA